MLNKVFLAGRLTAHPEIKVTSKEKKSIAWVTVAVERDYKNKAGEKITDFVTVLAKEKDAEFVSKYFNKGDTIIIEAVIEDWSKTITDENGKKKRHTEFGIVLKKAYFGEKKNSRTTVGNTSTNYEDAANSSSEV